SIKVPGMEKAPAATRSAIPVEFGLDDPQERADATRANVKQVLDHHTAALISKIDAERKKVGANDSKGVVDDMEVGDDNFGTGSDAEVGAEDTPIVLQYHHLMLLAPDKVRAIGSADPALVYRADNERLLVNESYQANQF